jgi:hypothetical protein
VRVARRNAEGSGFVELSDTRRMLPGCARGAKKAQTAKNEICMPRVLAINKLQGSIPELSLLIFCSSKTFQPLSKLSLDLPKNLCNLDGF